MWDVLESWLAVRLPFLSVGKVKSITPHGPRRPKSKPVREAPVQAVPLIRRTETAAPDERAARDWKTKTPPIVPLWREGGAGPIFPAFVRVVAPPSRGCFRAGVHPIGPEKALRSRTRMSLGQELAPHLPFLRRYARALT